MPDLISPRPTRRTVWRRWAANEWLWAAGLTLAALVIRLPYQLTIPPAGDEPNQIIYAQRIALGQITPWVGNDAYAGPFFFYLLALLLRLGFRDPMLGSFIVLRSGVLTVPLTYVMAKYMLRHKGLSLVAAGLVATNPAGMAYAIRQRLWLLVMLVAPVVLIVPILSAHYGDLFAARFTTFLTPILAISMGGVLSGVGLQFFSMAWMTRLWRGAKTGLVVLAVSFPLVPLFQYYAQVEAYQQSGWPWLELSREMVDANQGERVYISDSGLQQQIRGIPFVPQAYLILGDIRHDLLPLNQIIGQLYAAPGPALLMLSPADVAVLSQIGTLAPWPGAANAQALTRGFGLYRLDANVSLIKPEYVIDEAAFHARPPAAPLHLQVGDSLELMGYDFPQHASPGQTLELAFYWRKTGPLPSGPYMGFIHLLNVSTSTLVAQVDHLLGGDRYPVEAWQPNEIVVDRYVLALGTEAPLGALEIRTGVYVWPDLTRLSAPGFPDNVITLKSIAITP